MKRAHHETFSNEIVFIDTTGSCDQTDSNITFMFGASKVGAIPMRCVIHTSQNEQCYYNAFMALKDAIGQCGFFNKSPSAIMTDDSSAERNALNKVFPTSKLLLCSFHVCQAMWRRPWDTNHGIENMHRKSVMLMFRLTVFERHVTACEELMKEFLSHHLVSKYPLLYKTILHNSGNVCSAKTLQVKKLDNYTYHVTCPVELNEKKYLKTSPMLSFEDRLCLTKLSEGKEIDESFFQNMTESMSYK